MPDDVHLIKEVQALRARRLLRTLAVVQDLSDALMAVNDVTGDLVLPATGRCQSGHTIATNVANASRYCAVVMQCRT